jgi:cellulose biosynthesis protein BcsQ
MLAPQAGPLNLQNLEAATRHMVHRLAARADIDMAVIANDESHWNLERRVAGNSIDYEEGLRALVQYLLGRYAYVIADCPPGWTLASEHILRSADFVLCPVVPDHFSVWGMQTFAEYMKMVGRQSSVWRFVITMRTNTRTSRDQISIIYRDFQRHMIFQNETTAAASDLIIFDRTQKMVDGVGLRVGSQGLLAALDRTFGPDQSRNLLKLANQIVKIMDRGSTDG